MDIHFMPRIGAKGELENEDELRHLLLFQLEREQKGLSELLIFKSDPEKHKQYEDKVKELIGGIKSIMGGSQEKVNQQLLENVATNIRTALFRIAGEFGDINRARRQHRIYNAKNIGPTLKTELSVGMIPAKDQSILTGQDTEEMPENRPS